MGVEGTEGQLVHLGKVHGEEQLAGLDCGGHEGERGGVASSGEQTFIGLCESVAGTAIVNELEE